MSLQPILDGLAARKTSALARAISMVENGTPGFEELLASLHGKLGRARRVGITGPPGAGKSTLTEQLSAAFRAQGYTVGVIAIDPSSPFTGGALLGDRIRMERSSLDEGVFIRSMASRGSMGGMATTTGEVADVMDAFGFDRIIIETVGVGQSELDVMAASDTTVVVLVPESGDGIQVMKAGLMEIADVFVVNKADRDGAHALMAELRFSVHLHYTGGGAAKDIDWETPVLSTEATRDVGIVELMAALQRHRSALEASGALRARRQSRRRGELEALLVEEFTAQVMARVQTDEELARTIEAV